MVPARYSKGKLFQQELGLGIRFRVRVTDRVRVWIVGLGLGLGIGLRIVLGTGTRVPGSLPGYPVRPRVPGNFHYPVAVHLKLSL